jgi:hypothetical protein
MGKLTIVALAALALSGCVGMYRSGASNSGGLWGGVSQHVGDQVRR